MSAARSFDHAGLQLLQFLFVVGAHPYEQVTRGARLLLVHLGDREADVDQDPVAGADSAPVAVKQTDVDIATHTRDVDLGEPVLLIDDCDDLTRYCQTHEPGSTTGHPGYREGGNPRYP